MMKSITLTLIILLGSIEIVFSQSTEPFKKANTIEIETKLPADEAYKAWGNLQ